MPKEWWITFKKQHFRSREDWLTHISNQGVAPGQAGYQKEVIFKPTYWLWVVHLIFIFLMWRSQLLSEIPLEQWQTFVTAQLNLYQMTDCPKNKLRVSNWADISVSLEHKQTNSAVTSLPREHQQPQMEATLSLTHTSCLYLSAQEGWRGSISIVSKTIPSHDPEIQWDN